MKLYIRTTKTAGDAMLYSNPKINGKATWVKLGISVDIEKWFETYSRDRYGNVVKPKYDLISSHCGRRSLITLMFLSHKYDIKDIMSLSGHKTESAFNLYIKATAEQKVDSLISRVRSNGDSTLF